MPSKIAIVRIRGIPNKGPSVARTLQLLKLGKKNWCAVFDDSKDLRGMLMKVKDYATWGEVNEEILRLLNEKRGKKPKGEQAKGKKPRAVFGLHPPRGGFERKGIKQPFTKGGALGDRKEKINDLLKRMT